MPRFLQLFIDGFYNLLSVIFTGGKYGSSVPGQTEYGKRQIQREKDFNKYGGHPCKICNTRIPGNKLYCAACFFKYVKK